MGNNHQNAGGNGNHKNLSNKKVLGKKGSHQHGTSHGHPSSGRVVLNTNLGGMRNKNTEYEEGSNGYGSEDENGLGDNYLMDQEGEDDYGNEDN